MKTVLRNPGPAFSGEFTSEVALPVSVTYSVDTDGNVEVLQVRIEGVPFLEAPAKLLWERLPLRDQRALDIEAEGEARRILEDREEERALSQ